jgi:hypothetical protein
MIGRCFGNLKLSFFGWKLSGSCTVRVHGDGDDGGALLEPPAVAFFMLHFITPQSDHI